MPVRTPGRFRSRDRSDSVCHLVRLHHDSSDSRRRFGYGASKNLRHTASGTPHKMCQFGTLSRAISRDWPVPLDIEPVDAQGSGRVDGETIDRDLVAVAADEDADTTRGERVVCFRGHQRTVDRQAQAVADGPH